MKHSIIKDFKGWTSLMEAAGAAPNVPPGAQPAASADPGGQAIRATMTGSDIPPGDGQAMIAEITSTPLTPIASADGTLTRDDVISVQKILIADGHLAAKQKSGKPAYDGLIGPMTTAALQSFRAANLNDAGGESTKVDKAKGVTIGAKTLAKINEFIKNPSLMTKTGAANTTNTTTAAPQNNTTTTTTVAPAAANTTNTTTAAPVVDANADAPSAAETLVNQITTYFQDKTNWQQFKGRGGIFGNDNEKGAIEAFTIWYNNTIQPTVDKMQDSDPNKKNFLTLLPVLKNGIERKLNKVTFPYIAKDGTAKTATINADF